MIARCYTPSSTNYKNYGARGIKVSEEWRIFENFYKDMGEKPRGLEIDRINNDGDYERSNCHWATRSENQRNKRTSWKNIIKDQKSFLDQ